MFLKNDLDNLLSSNLYYSLVIDTTEEGGKNVIRVIIRTCKYNCVENKRKLILSNCFECKYNESLLKYVNRLFDKMNIDIEKVLSITTDGCFVNTGRRKGILKDNEQVNKNEEIKKTNMFFKKLFYTHYCFSNRLSLTEG